MLGLVAVAISLAGFAAAQESTFKPTTGVRSLWIPFKTVEGTPDASIAGTKAFTPQQDEVQNATIYVVSCPTASPQCAIAPNLTVTEGESTVEYTTTNSAGTAVLDCTLTGTTSALCKQGAMGGGNVQKTSTTIGADQIVYQAVDVTQTATNSSTIIPTVTVTAEQSTTSSTETSTGGVQTITNGPWAIGGAIGAGVLALAAL